ncbi:MAG TPA: hypothetical protein VF043_27120 [Ktedonobacteraceae bacterium]
MKILSQLVKILPLLLIALSILLNISLGLAIFFIWRFVTGFKKMADLQESGKQVMATVTRIETFEVRSSIVHPEQQAKLPRQMYRLIATWQHPETGKSYTLKAPIRSPENFPIGSSVAFLVNYDNPRWHRLDDPMMEAYKAIKNDVTSEENSSD